MTFEMQSEETEYAYSHWMKVVKLERGSVSRLLHERNLIKYVHLVQF